MQKPKEFWIYEQEDDDTFEKYFIARTSETKYPDNYPFVKPQCIHAIEKSAYDELKMALEDIADMSPCSAELEAAFYARQVLKLAPYDKKAMEGK